MKGALIMKAIRSSLTLPPRFYEYEIQEDDDEKSSCEKFIILGGLQKFELKQVEIILGLERYCNVPNPYKARSISTTNF